MPYSDAALALATRHVTEGRSRVGRMQIMIDDAMLRRADTAEMHGALDAMIVTLGLMEEHKARIENEREARKISN